MNKFIATQDQVDAANAFAAKMAKSSARRTQIAALRATGMTRTEALRVLRAG